MVLKAVMAPAPAEVAAGAASLAFPPPVPPLQPPPSPRNGDRSA